MLETLKCITPLCNIPLYDCLSAAPQPTAADCIPCFRLPISIINLGHYDPTEAMTMTVWCSNVSESAKTYVENNFPRES